MATGTILIGAAGAKPMRGESEGCPLSPSLFLPRCEAARKKKTGVAREDHLILPHRAGSIPARDSHSMCFFNSNFNQTIKQATGRPCREHAHE